MLASRARTIPTVADGTDPSPSGPTAGPDDTTRGPEVDLWGPDAEPDGPAPGPQLTGLGSLTRREQDVLGFIARGHSNADMAEVFVISEGTVKTHVKRVLSKLELRDRTQAAVFAYESGFVKRGGAAPSSEPVDIKSYRTSSG